METANVELLPAYKDLSLRNRPGEKWKDIVGLENYYQISNYGRVKSLEREVMTGLGCVFMPKRIKKVSILKTKNKTHNDFTNQLMMTVTIDRKCHNHTVRRLVYYHFVEPFNLTDKNILVLMKNGNGLDIYPENLVLASALKKVRKSVKTGRMKNTFAHVDKHRAGMLSGKVTSKSVSQYDSTGKLVATFSGMHEAQRKTGISHNSICAVCNGRQTNAGGYYWRHGNASFLDTSAIQQERKARKRLIRGTKVKQLSMEGNEISTFNSLQDAAETIGCQWTSISACIRGIYKSAGGFKWERILS